MQWGTAQAQAFLNAWQTGYFQTNVGIGGRTFFLDVESANGGWTGGSAYYTANQQVLIGALTYLNGISNLIGEAASAGLYIMQSDWTSWFGSNFNPEQPFVYWVPGAGTGCPSCAEAQTAFPPVGPLGGYEPMLWQFQYFLAGCGDGKKDFDITPYEGYWLNSLWTPVAG